MKKMLSVFLAMFLCLSVFAVAQEEPTVVPVGITPDSKLYFLDKMFSVFKNREKLAMERAVEAKLMHEKGNDAAAGKALESYAKVVDKLKRTDVEKYEHVVEMTGKHLEVLQEVAEKVPETASEVIATVIARRTEMRSEQTFFEKPVQTSIDGKNVSETNRTQNQRSENVSDERANSNEVRQTQD
ncbi:MAG: DUF5667 domain-containing protein [bacterium]|nr:DUF5667 domain-containing protein [bacterium]